MSRGAFTVANINDTQGNGTADTEDSPVRPYGTSISSSAPGGGLSEGSNFAYCSNTGGFNVGDTVAIFDSNPGYQKLPIIAINPNVSVTFGGAFDRDYPAGATMQHYGRDEVDLMPLTIYPPSPIQPGNYQEQVFVNGPATLWLDKVKQNMAGNGVIYTINDVRTLSASGLTLYVEAGQSQSMRDISIRLKYNGVSDVVKATGTWAALTAVESATKSAAGVLAEFPDMTGGPADTVNQFGGTGLRPVADSYGVRSVIVLQFSISPSRVRPDGTVDGSWEADNVNFDITRQLAGRAWTQQTAGGTWTEVSIGSNDGPQYPMTEEYANDDEYRPHASREVFLERYYSLNRPVVLTHAMRSWRALRDWRPEYFKERFGQQSVEIMSDRDADPRYEIESHNHKKSVLFAEYVDMVTRTGETNDYYLAGNNRLFDKPWAARLLDDIEMFPEYLNPRDTAGKVFFWFGPAGTVTPMHHDTMNILMAQVYGRKRVKLIPSYQWPLVYNSVGVFSDVDSERPEHAACPKFREATVIDLVLNPGEVLFLPVGWWHHVRALDVSITVTFTNFLFDNTYHWDQPHIVRR